MDTVEVRSVHLLHCVVDRDLCVLSDVFGIEKMNSRHVDEVLRRTTTTVDERGSERDRERRRQKESVFSREQTEEITDNIFKLTLDVVFVLHCSSLSLHSHRSDERC